LDFACLAGPALAGVLGVGVLGGADGAVFALAVCSAVPAVVSCCGRSARRKRDEVAGVAVAGDSARG